MNEHSAMKRGKAISPLDGRYRSRVDALAEEISEFALMRERVRVEVEWFLFIAGHEGFPEVPAPSDADAAYLRSLYTDFGESEFDAIGKLERITNHDVKAVEYYVKARLDATQLGPHREFVHFGCTSEDINNLAYAAMLKGAVENIWKVKLFNIQKMLCAQAYQYRDLSMLSRTHGQNATPTTFGKEIAVTAYRLKRQLAIVDSFEYLGKFNGATGTFSAHMFAFPDINWIDISKKFVESFGLSYNPLTTQIESHDFISEICDTIARTNVIIRGFCVDIWLYISLG